MDTALQLLFQTACLGCHDYGTPVLCGRCALLSTIKGPQCSRCGNAVSQPIDGCGNCNRRAFPITGARSYAWLGLVERELLHRVKFNGRFELLELVRENVLRQFTLFFPPDPIVVPVPLHPKRWRERGFNQSYLLARWLARRFGWSIDERMRKTQATEAQSTLTRRQRLRNLRQSFEWSGGDPPARVLLVDDVWTTGATLEACAGALKKIGVDEIYAWTLFRVPPINDS